MSTELDEIFELLKKEKFTIINDFDDYFKCTICKEIIINAYQAPCLCNFCEVCINNYNVTGSLNCPGNTPNCKSSDLSNIEVNKRLNKQISFLKVRCPYSVCSYECELNKMEDHMRFCTRKYVNCPFFNVGCDSRERNIDKLNDHMLLEIVNHNKILIDIIGNLRNEVYELKEKEERNRNEIDLIGNLRNEVYELNEKVERYRNEIEILKKKDEEKNEIISSLKEEIEMIKKLNKEFDDQFRFSKRYLLSELEKINIKIIDNTKNDDINLLTDKIMKNLDEIVSHKLIDNQNEKLNENDLSEINLINEINQINKYLNMCYNGELLWPIGNIGNLNEYTWSEYFYDKENPYKMQIILWTRFEDFRIGLRIGSGNFDADLKWPCRVNIKIMLGASGHYEKPFKQDLFIETIDSNPFEDDKCIKITGNDFKQSLNFYKTYDLICKVKFL